ncbi:MAG: 16S rRNA (cytosine(1402)-N(4))-methyltransferase RsmH [Candidatus Hydrogenedentes bacterium]|nr:16S rRNA (cytosine(1402)-N(4))-methyltransferase RsmH [Candidatus Hydrogenedentota bacterium]
MANPAPHVPVLAGPALEFLRVRPDGCYVDCTAGAGGHSALIAARLTTGRLIALDRDPLGVELTRERLRTVESATVLLRNYAELADVLHEHHTARVDGVLLDAGLSSMQIDDPDRGFSFQSDGPLDMRMSPQESETAAAFLPRVTEDELVRALREYGDLRQAGRIARAIISRREQGALQRTGDLRDAVKEALPFVKGVPEEVRTVFQAVRIALNQELRWLEDGVRQAIDALAPGGRFVAITFHSGEDRVVKNLLRDAGRPQRLLHPDGRVRQVIPPRVRVLTPSPVVADDEETRVNPRAKSAKLRAVERLPEGEI